jgi:endonuclease/exonuclease/phosphatase family metal-dependent hydrolase
MLITNSVVPNVDELLCQKTYKQHEKKYSTSQLREIEEALAVNQEERHRLVSYNMLVNDRDETWDEEYRWKKRMPRIVTLLTAMNPDIIASQELLPQQLEDLQSNIGSTYAYVGGPREFNGEYTGIFYRKERYEVLMSALLPITETKNALAMLTLKDRISQKAFAIFTIHLAWDINARDFEARFTAQKIAEFLEKEQLPVLFTGDLNTFSNRPDVPQYPCYDGDYINRLIIKGSRLLDAKQEALLGHFGPISTFTNAPDGKTPFQGTGTPGIMLDHIYISEGVRVLTHAVEPALIEGHFPSDHMPVFIDYVLQPDALNLI